MRTGTWVLLVSDYDLSFVYFKGNNLRILERYWRHSRMKIALSVSFRILICSESQRNLFSAYKKKGCMHQCRNKMKICMNNMKICKK